MTGQSRVAQVVYRVLAYLAEEDLFRASHVDRRWRALALDPHLTCEARYARSRRGKVEAHAEGREKWQTVRDRFRAALEQAGKQGEQLKEAIQRHYEAEGMVMVNVLKARMTTLLEALCHQVCCCLILNQQSFPMLFLAESPSPWLQLKSFQVEEHLDKLLKTYEDQEKLGRLTGLGERKGLYSQLAKQAIEMYAFVNVSTSVADFDDNPFVTVPFKRGLLSAVDPILKMLAVPRTPCPVLFCGVPRLTDYS